MQKEPDILIVEMPVCRMASSGPLSDDDEIKRFEAAWNRLASQNADKVNPRDYMYIDEESGKSVWLYLVEDWMSEDDIDGFEIIPFEGGLYASALADNWDYSEYERVYNGIVSWTDSQEKIQLDDKVRNLLFHFAGPHSAHLIELNYGKIRYFIPIKMIK
ncbi:MAG: hypothetical protein FWG30_08425 [Eubacteriaceae bacterium]|nr:hypothetical protein [Eubacteriaceae bacterium]